MRLWVSCGVVGHDLLVGCFHLRTTLRRAKLGDGAVEQVDLVVEVDYVHGEPFVLVFAFGQPDCLAQTPTAQCCLCVLLELPTAGAAVRLLRLEWCARSRVTRKRGTRSVGVRDCPMDVM